jgi:excisionase family DNA binding protein
LNAPDCPPPGLLEIPALAARLNVSVGHIRYLVRHQRIPYVRWGRLVRFDPDQIAAWLAANTHNGNRGS